MVRFGGPSDKNAVIRLLKESHQAAGFDFPFSAPHAARLFDQHLASGLILLCGNDVAGLLMAMTFEHPFGAGLWAKETVWYINPNSRGRFALKMLAAYEEWAKSKGCSKVGMASLSTNDVSRLFERKGYTPAETHFVKTLR